jgi:hypothetical protein
MLSPEEWGKSGWIKNKKHTVFSQARRMALHEFDHLDQFERIKIHLDKEQTG